MSLSACGTEAGDPPAARGEWTQQVLKGRPGADAPVGFAADGDDVLVAVLSEDGTLTSHLSRDGGEFETGEPVVVDGGGFPGFADPVRLDGVWWLVGTGGMLGEGDDETFAFEPRVLRSDDGLSWEQVAVSGIPAPVDVNDVIAGDGALVVVGAERNQVDTGGDAGFEAAVWRSEDGATWTEVALPGVVPLPEHEDESGAYRVVASGERLLIGGSVDGGHGQIWSSEDAGRTWSREQSREVDDLYQVAGLAAVDSTVVVSASVHGDEGGSRILRSTDGGETYVEAADQPTADGEGWGPVWAAGGRFFTVGRPGFENLGDPELCYADLASCYYGGDSDVTLVFMSDDGDRWSVLDVSDADVGDEIIGLTSAGPGRTLLANVDEGVVVSSWPAGVPLPEGERPAAPERVELVTVPEGEDPEPGVRYHAPLYVHCGMDWLYLGDRPWQRTDGGPDLETGVGDDPSDEWPMAGETIYGFATMDDDGVVAYSIGGAEDEVIATYERTGVRPPGCD